MELVKATERARLVDPTGRESEQVIEHRTDPLTGAVASVNVALGEKAKAFLGTADLDLLRETEERSKAGCPFCSAAERGTRFPPETFPEGQLRVGDALAMPNLFSKCAFDCVVVVDPASHVLSPSRIKPEAIGDALRAAAELVRRARRRDTSLVHHLLGMNFLHPGGSSVPHPHLQIHVRSVPYSGVSRARRACAAWRERTGRAFFEELLDAERGGPRWVGRIGAVEWIAAFAPAHQREVWGILPGTASLAELDDAGAGAFAAGISRIVSSYEEAGVHPFTLAFLSSPVADPAEGFALHVKVCSRPAFKPLFANYDTWFGPLFAGDEVHTEPPETTAARLRPRF